MILNRQPLLILVIAFILGIFIQEKCCFEQNLIVIFSLFSTLIFGFFFLKNRIIFKIRDVLLAVFFCFLGIVFHYFNSLQQSDFNFDTNEKVVFKISKKLNSNDKYKKYEALVEVEGKQFSAVVNLPKNEVELDFTHYYKAKAFVVRPKSPEYNFQFDYAKYLHRKGIFYQIYCNEILSSAQRKDLSWNEKIKQQRLDVLHKIDHVEIKAQSREFLKGIILADRTEMNAETVRDFNRSGLVHFLAISGTHIAVIFGMFYFLLTRFSPAGFRKYSIILSLLLIWVFAFFIGLGNSVVRSCIMITVYFVYVLLQRKPDLLHSLALSAFIILMIDAQQVFDVGFQLSFLAVLGIFWLNEPILKLFPRRDNFFKKVIFNTISISIAAQLATLPLVLLYFHQFSLFSVLANFVIVPFSELIIVFSFIMTLLFALNVDFHFINVIYDFVIQILLKLIHWFANFDIVFFENIPMNWVEVFSLLAIVYFLRAMIVKFNFKNSSKVVLAVLVFGLIRVSSSIIEQEKSEILVHHYKKDAIISVKQGREVVFYMKNEKDISKVKQYIINPYVSNRRVKVVKLKTIPALAKALKINGKTYSLE